MASATIPAFALIGAGGYIAPRHMRAIKDVGGELVAALDPCDSVGIIDSYFPNARFFVEFERFDRHVDKLRRAKTPVDFVSVCSPNYLHDAHVRFGLRSGADVICEKPLVLNPWNVDALEEIMESTGRKVNTILQLRLHPTIQELRKKVASRTGNALLEVDLTYITSRGRWYGVSWKGDERKSGGIATNIGIHFFDMLFHVFGPLKESTVHLHTPERAAGHLVLENASVRWFLSINANDLPDGLPAGQTTYRSITVGGQELEFSSGFTDLHTQSYEAILKGEGFALEEARPSIEATANIRTARVEPGKGDRHPFVERVEA